MHVARPWPRPSTNLDLTGAPDIHEDGGRNYRRRWPLAKRDKNHPTLSEQGHRAAGEREQRLAGALRENLSKRKAQRRARVARDSGGEPASLAGRPEGATRPEPER